MTEELRQAHTIQTETFDLQTYVPTSFRLDDRLTVYIEGDGLSWITPSRVSSDPTPRNPLALRLALAHPNGNAAYLARPCQYIRSPGCSRDYWMHMRFSSAVVTATDKAITQLKARFQANHLTLVGFSGGGTIAALVAARRDDVDRLITISGNLDHRAWTTWHHLAPLTGSLNPVDYVDRLSGIRQWHFVGGNDKIIPPELVEGFADRFPSLQRPRVLTETDFDHHCCWDEEWPRLWRQIGQE